MTGSEYSFPSKRDTNGQQRTASLNSETWEICLGAFLVLSFNENFQDPVSTMFPVGRDSCLFC